MCWAHKRQRRFVSLSSSPSRLGDRCFQQLKGALVQQLGGARAAGGDPGTPRASGRSGAFTQASVSEHLHKLNLCLGFPLSDWTLL